MGKFKSIILKIRTKQLGLLLGLLGIASLGLIILSYIAFNKEAMVASSKKNDKKILTGSSRINPQEVWVHRFNIDAALTQKRLEALEASLDKLLKLNVSSLPMTQLDCGSCSSHGVGAIDLKQDFTQNQTTKLDTGEPALKSHASLLPPAPAAKGKYSESQNLTEGATSKPKALQKITLNLNHHPANQPLKSTDNSIPAGAFAKAVLLGGVDASTSIQASSDPRPILLRLVNSGTLPRRFKSDLEGCHVLAASYGDLSSERVFMRLEKLTCVERKTGEVLEMNVQGYVAGEDGRAGLRGKLVDRAGESMRSAMLGGFFSSMGHFLGQSRSPVLFSPHTGLNTTNPLSASDLLKQSTANGVSGALDKYADFYIKRAEQMQPVIQVAAGRKADIVFTQGTEFADSSLRQSLSKINDQKRYQQVQALEESKPLSHWQSFSEGEK